MNNEFNKRKEYKRMLDCPDCGSSRTYYRFKDKKMVCEKCGNLFEKPLKPKES